MSMIQTWDPISVKSSFTFRVELDARVEVVSEDRVGIAAFVSRELPALELFATREERLELCELTLAPPGPPEARCVDVGGFSMNAWHHIVWIGTQPSAAVSRSTVAIDCGPESAAFDADNERFTTDPSTFNFGAGADGGHLNAPAVVLIDNLTRTIGP